MVDFVPSGPLAVLTHHERPPMHPETKSVHTGVYQDQTFNSVTTPIYPSSTFYFDAIGKHRGFDYSRTGNPTRAGLEQNLADLENGHGASITCTGMAAVTTLMFLFKPGDHIITGNDIYGGTYRSFAVVFRPISTASQGPMAAASS